MAIFNSTLGLHFITHIITSALNLIHQCISEINVLSIHDLKGELIVA